MTFSKGPPIVHPEEGGLRIEVETTHLGKRFSRVVVLSAKGSTEEQFMGTARKFWRAFEDLKEGS